MGPRTPVAAVLVIGALLAGCAGTCPARSGPATDLALDVVMARAALAELETRYGEKHPEILAQQARLAALERHLTQLEAEGHRVDRSALEAAIEVELARVDAELAGLGVTCGPEHPQVVAARRRKEALERVKTGGR